jgi:hypothetical protein
MSDQNTETYQVVFNSQGSNTLTPVATAINRTAITYDINWEAIIPRNKYNKFRCQFTFQSTIHVGHNQDIGFVNMNLGRVNIYDGAQQSQNLGIIYQVYPNTTVGAGRSYFHCASDDNNEFVIDYPNNHMITIRLNAFNGNIMVNMPHYVLTLNLTGFNV